MGIYIGIEQEQQQEKDKEEKWSLSITWERRKTIKN